MFALIYVVVILSFVYKMVLFNLVAKVTSEGTKKDRTALIKALGKEKKHSQSKATAGYLEWLTKMANSKK